MREMAEAEASEFVTNNKFGVLSLADGGRAYGLPLFYGFDGQALYFHVHPGLKLDYMRATREACFTIVRVMTLDDWASVQAFGPLEPIRDPDELLAATQALMRLPLPPEWGETAYGAPRRSPEMVAGYRLRVVRWSGRYSQTARASPEEREIAFGGM
jgi:nitroimidazol reductase NimA-like FMN-containing flavoprotein (pyridoxamine 5'-phosphate oxidase superfamily)